MTVRRLGGRGVMVGHRSRNDKVYGCSRCDKRVRSALVIGEEVSREEERRVAIGSRSKDPNSPTEMFTFFRSPTI
jgi:hypothetical protein